MRILRLPAPFLALILAAVVTANAQSPRLFDHGPAIADPLDQSANLEPLYDFVHKALVLCSAASVTERETPVPCSFLRRRRTPADTA